MVDGIRVGNYEQRFISCNISFLWKIGQFILSERFLNFARHNFSSLLLKTRSTCLIFFLLGHTEKIILYIEWQATWRWECKVGRNFFFNLTMIDDIRMFVKIVISKKNKLVFTFKILLFHYNLFPFRDFLYIETSS